MGEKPILFVWIPLNIDSEDSALDISSWINKDGTPNIDIEKMQAEIEEELIRRAKKTEEWQGEAILLSVPTD